VLGLQLWEAFGAAPEYLLVMLQEFIKPGLFWVVWRRGKERLDLKNFSVVSKSQSGPRVKSRGFMAVPAIGFHQ